MGNDPIPPKIVARLLTLFQDFQFAIHKPTCFHCDNFGSIAVVVNPGVNPRTRHIATHYHFTREKIGSGDVELEYIPPL